MDGNPNGVAKLRWRAYYNNGQTISSQERAWEAIPSGNIVAVVWQYGDQPVKVELGTPYYLKMGNMIIRVWDATLYLRGMGTVKFGRWATKEIFDSAWQEAARSVTVNDSLLADKQAMNGGVIAGTHIAKENTPPSYWMVWYDDMTKAYGVTQEEWNKIPSDGIMAAMHSVTMNGVTLAVAMRRYTFYLWNDRELINTDDFDAVIDLHPAFKRGTPAFVGGDYLGQGRAIKEALDDTLEDLNG